jgi:hypothetical protein
LARICPSDITTFPHSSAHSPDVATFALLQAMNNQSISLLVSANRWQTCPETVGSL